MARIIKKKGILKETTYENKMYVDGEVEKRGLGELRYEAMKYIHFQYLHNHGNVLEKY